MSISNQQGRRYRFHFASATSSDFSCLNFSDSDAVINFIRRFPNQDALHAFTEKCVLQESNHNAALSDADNFQRLLADMIVSGKVSVIPQATLQPTVRKTEETTA